MCLAAGNPPNARSVSVAERRAQLAELMSSAARRSPIGAVEDRHAPGPRGPARRAHLQSRARTPVEHGPAALLPGLVYFHGGGLVAGHASTPTTRSPARCAMRRLPRGLGGLPPRARAPFPAGLEDAPRRHRLHRRATRRTSASMPRGSASAATRPAPRWPRRPARPLARAAGDPRLALQLLICPILDYSRSTGSRARLRARLPGRSGHPRSRPASTTLPGGRRSAPIPRISPLRAADLSGMPPHHHPHRRIRSAAR